MRKNKRQEKDDEKKKQQTITRSEISTATIKQTGDDHVITPM